MIGFRRTPKTLGAQGEELAAKALRQAGYRILGRNVKLGAYEIDLIARDGDTTVFVEVKTRRSAGPIPPEDNVGYTKRRHIRAAARRYKGLENDPAMYYRFDIVAVIIPESGTPSVNLIRDAFQ